MATGVCASTSFRLLMRRTTDFTHYTRRSTSLRILPISTISVNTWSFGGRQSYCTNKTEDLNSGKTTTGTSASPNATHKKHKKTSSLTAASSTAKIMKSNSIHNERNLAEINLIQMQLKELKLMCRGYGLKAIGNKSALIKRLQDYIEQQEQEMLHKTKTKQTAAFEEPQSSIANTMSTSLQQPIHAIDTPANALGQQLNISQDLEVMKNHLISHYSTRDVANNDGDNNNNNNEINNNHNHKHGDVSVEYIQGLPHLTIPLPSRNEKCRFALKPVSHKVGDLIEMLKTEDRGIDRATILNNSGVRIASTCNIESLMDDTFWIHINDQKYKVVPPKRDRIPIGDLKKLGEIKALVAQLYEALNVGEYHIEKEQELTTKLEDLKYKIAPLEREKAELSAQAERKTNVMTWVGLGLMSVQFGILARLTWWEYSWDIMEPVTYFVTYGTAMAMYAYYCITKTEYNMPEVKDRHYLITLYKRAKKKSFDVDTYNELKRQIAEIEYDLRRLRDPLNLQLPPHVNRSQQHPPLGAVPPPPSELASQVSPSNIKKSGFKIPFLVTKN